MKKNALIIWTLLLVLSCEKDSGSVFSGITELDEEGVLIGNIDLTDWRFDDVWNEREEALFSNANFKSAKNITVQKDIISDSQAGSISRAFPNPAKSVLNFKIESSADSIEFVILGNNYNVIYSGKVVGGNLLWSLNVADRNKFSANTIYRIYYKLDHLNDNDEKGHGDIKIIN
jgi:hypothetical protein